MIKIYITSILIYASTALQLYIKTSHWCNIEAYQTIAIGLTTGWSIYIKYEVILMSAYLKTLKSTIHN